MIRDVPSHVTAHRSYRLLSTTTATAVRLPQPDSAGIFAHFLHRKLGVVDPTRNKVSAKEKTDRRGSVWYFEIRTFGPKKTRKAGHRASSFLTALYVCHDVCIEPETRNSRRNTFRRARPFHGVPPARSLHPPGGRIWHMFARNQRRRETRGGAQPPCASPPAAPRDAFL